MINGSIRSGVVRAGLGGDVVYARPDNDRLAGKSGSTLGQFFKYRCIRKGRLQDHKAIFGLHPHVKIRISTELSNKFGTQWTIVSSKDSNLHAIFSKVSLRMLRFSQNDDFISIALSTISATRNVPAGEPTGIAAPA